MVLCMHSYLVATTRLARLPACYGSSLCARLVIISLSTRCCACCVDVQALRAAHLDLQLAQAAVDGAPWAACDLAGLPLGASDAQLQACKDRWVPGGKNCCELRASLGGGGVHANRFLCQPHPRDQSLRLGCTTIHGSRSILRAVSMCAQPLCIPCKYMAVA
jgi:hypothetical protein